MLETEELISKFGSHHILQEAVIVQLNGVLAIWPHKRASKHMVRVIVVYSYRIQ